MSKTLSVDLILNSMGFKQGIDQAKAGTEEYASAVKISDNNIKQLNQAMRAAQKETKALAIAFNSLSKAEQESAQGRALERQMYDSAEAAAKLQDVVSDTTAMIRAMASDTAGLDALKQGLDIGKSAALGYAGAIAKLTGDEKALKDVVAQVTMVEGFFGAAIKITNALQKQSSIMIGIRRLQHLAAKKAVQAETAALGEATIAQKAFNAVAKANPYVLIISAAVAAAAAIGTYMLATKKATEEEDKLQKELEESKKKWDEYDKQIVGSAAEVVAKYTILQRQWKALKTEHEKNEFIENNKKKFDELGISVKNVKDAEDIFTNNTGNVVQALEARAKAAAMYNVLVDAMVEYAKNGGNLDNLFKTEQVETDKLVDALKKQTEGYRQIKKVREEAYDPKLAPTDAINTGQPKTVEPIKIDSDEEKISKLFNTFIDLQSKAAESSKNLNTTTTKTNKDNITYLQKLQGYVTTFQKQLENLDPSLPNFSELKDKITKALKDAQQAVKDYKILVGIEAPKSKLDELKDKLKEAEAELPFAVSEEDVEQAQAKIKRLKDEIEKEEIRLKIKIDVEAEKAKADAQEISDIVKNALENEDIEPKWDFSSLPESMQDAANETVAKMKKIGDAIKQLQKIRDKSNNKDTKNRANTQINALKKEQKALKETAEGYQEQADEQKKHDEKMKLNQQSYDSLAQSIGTVGNALRQMGAEEAAVAVEFVANSAKMIMQCIQNIAAMQAQAMAAGTASGAALPFPANIAAIASILATIIGIFASLPVFAEGGVVPGSSFTGDKVLARLNSGERVLTAKQNENLEKIANGVASGINNIFVEGVIKGKDLMLVQKNYNNLARKSGQQINIQ